MCIICHIFERGGGGQGSFLISYIYICIVNRYIRTWPVGPETFGHAV